MKDDERGGKSKTCTIMGTKTVNTFKNGIFNQVLEHTNF